MRSQGYGKRRCSVGMPRPKKSKVQALGESRQNENTGVAGDRPADEKGDAAVCEQDEHASEEVEEASDKEARQQANELVKMARAGVREAAVSVTVAEAALRHEKRRAEERWKRWEAAEQRAQPPPAYLQLERVYKGKVKMLQARLALSEARTGAAEAGERLQECLLMREELAHALTRDKLVS